MPQQVIFAGILFPLIVLVLIFLIFAYIYASFSATPRSPRTGLVHRRTDFKQFPTTSVPHYSLLPIHTLPTTVITRDRDVSPPSISHPVHTAISRCPNPRVADDMSWDNISLLSESAWRPLTLPSLGHDDPPSLPNLRNLTPRHPSRAHTRTPSGDSDVLPSSLHAFLTGDDSEVYAHDSESSSMTIRDRRSPEEFPVSPSTPGIMASSTLALPSFPLPTTLRPSRPLDHVERRRSASAASFDGQGEVVIPIVLHTIPTIKPGGGANAHRRSSSSVPSWLSFASESKRRDSIMSMDSTFTYARPVSSSTVSGRSSMNPDLSSCRGGQHYSALSYDSFYIDGLIDDLIERSPIQ